MPEATAETLPAELRFLDAFRANGRSPLRSADWLRSDFNDSVWIVELQNSLRIDWSVPVGTPGLLLTDTRHEPLWTAFRSWLLLQTDLAHNGGRIYSPVSIYNRLRNVTIWIDYFLLNADRLGLAEHGLMVLSENDFKSALSTISSRASVLDSIYDWAGRVTGFLRAKIEGLTNEQVSTALKDQPLIALCPDVEARDTHLEGDDVIKARAWLWMNGFYSEAPTAEYRHVVDAGRLAVLVYPSIVRRAGRFRHPRELALGPRQYRLREMPRASVVTSLSDRLSDQRYELYRGLLHSMGALKPRGCSVPHVAGTGVDVARNSVELKPKGRYRSIPYYVVLQGFRCGAEFALKHGEHLVASFLGIAKQAKAEGVSIASLSQRGPIVRFLHPETRRLGVESWSIEPNRIRTGITDNLTATSCAAYYVALRNHQSLYECLRVFYGAVQVVVGVLMARRQGELLDLVAGDCLDQTRTRLVFRNRKSGALGFRNLEGRPIPPLGVRLIETLEKLHCGLVRLGLTEKSGSLFASPASSGEMVLNFASSHCYNGALDAFCDYAEIPCNADGERYYFRQHQLRRFFAMAFFWCSGLDHLDTLRWFLGHTDLAHLYHYITTETPGDVLRGVKAEWAADHIARDDPQTEALASYLSSTYGSESFLLLDQQALAAHIDDLIEEGAVHIEPEFLDLGQRYRILVTVTSCEENR